MTRQRLKSQLRVDEMGNQFWELPSGRYHRLGGLPAVEYDDDSKEWWVEGLRHRLDGPAILWSKGLDPSWWILGIKYSYEAWLQKLKSDYPTEYEAWVAQVVANELLF